MNVNRTIWVNPVEPHPLSFRAPVGLETQLNVAFLTQAGTPYKSDIAAQLQLTGRSTQRTISYVMPATDIVNGRARATIPGGDLTDPNGYRLVMIGTLSGESTLLAIGSVAPVAAAGFDLQPIDVIDSIPLTFEYNQMVELDVAIWQTADKGTPLDLTSSATTVSANVYASQGGLLLAPFTVTVLNANTVRLTLTAEQVNTLPAACWWSLIGSGSGGATTLAEGTVTITGEVTPPLEETTADYDYQKPALGNVNPTSGQIIHDTLTQDLLKVAKVTGVTDMSATLELMRTGDEILLGATTWIVVSAFEASGWYEFRVTPIVQDAASGVTPVTFRRP